MKWNICISALLTVALVCLVSADEKKAVHKHQLASDFGECPDGHKALADIPIVYGLVGPLRKRPGDFDDKDRVLAEKADKGEIVLGGDVVSEHSPKSEVACKQCGFRYFPSDSPIEYPDMARWSKSAKNPKSFRHEFTKALLGFPRLRGSEDSVSYSQSFKADGKTLGSEAIMYHTSLPIENVLSSMRQWIKGQAGDPSALKRVEDASAHHTYEYDARGLSIRIMDDAFWKPGWILVSMDLQLAALP